MTPFQIAVRNNNLRISRYYLGCGRLEVHCVMGASMPFDWRDQTLLRLALKYATPELAQLILTFRHRLSTRRNTPTFSRIMGRHSRRHVDASLDLFTRKSPRTWRDLTEKKALSAPPFFVDGGSVN